MISRKFFGVALSVLFLSGCLWPGRSDIKPGLRSPADPVSVQVIQQDLWASGGPVVFIPFTPGAKAEAGEAADRLSLMIVKGVAESLAGSRGVFQLITDGNVEQARFVIEGHIDELDTGGKWKAVGIGKKNITLKISGEMRERSTGEVVALLFGFSSFKKVNDAGEMAYKLGRSIGEKIQH